MTLSKTLGAAALVALTLLGAPAAAQDAPPEFTIDTAGWTGGAQIQDGRFMSCSVSRRYDNGVTLVVGMNGRHQLNLGLLNPQWTLTKGEESTVEVAIDGDARRRFSALAATPQLLVVPVGENEALYDRLRRGSTLTVATGAAQLRFPLTGTAAGLAAMRACVDKARQLAERPAGAEPAQATGGISREQVARLLQQAGLADIRFAPPDDLPPGVVQGWMVGDDLLGGVVQRRRQSGDVRLDEFAEAFVQEVAKSCPEPVERDDGPAEVIADAYGLKTLTVRCRAGAQPTVMSVLVALDDFHYSAFFHQGAPADEQAASEATAALAGVIRDLARTAVDRGDRGGAAAPEATDAPGQ